MKSVFHTNRETQIVASNFSSNGGEFNLDKQNPKILIEFSATENELEAVYNMLERGKSLQDICNSGVLTILL